MKNNKKINKYFILWSLLLPCIPLPFYIFNINISELLKLDLIYFILFEMDASESQSYYPNYYVYINYALKIIPFICLFFFISSFIFIVKNYKKIVHSINLISQYEKFNLTESKQSFLKTFSTSIFVSLIISLLFYFSIPYLQYLSSNDINFIQLYISKFFIITFSSTLLLLCFFNQKMIFNNIKSFLFQQKSPYELAFFRIIFFTYVGLSNYGFFFKNTSWTDRTNKASLPYMDWFIHSFDLSVTQYQFICILGSICAFSIALGLWTRWMLILNSLLIFLIIATPNFHGKLNHNQIYIWISWIFVFSRCYDVWSVDALVKKFRNKDIDKSAKSDYGIPIKMIWLHLCIIYFFAGIYKLWDAGFDWALSESMMNQILVEWVQHYDWKPAVRIDHYPNIVQFGGLLTILFELAFPFLIFKFRHRIIAITGGILLHKSAGYFMKIAFLNLQILYLCFVNMDWVFHKFSLAKRKIQEAFFKIKIPKGKQENYFESILSNQKKIAIPKYGNAVLWLGISLLSLNSFCGLFAIHSYPFSAYPSYSDLVTSEIEMLHFEGHTDTGEEIDILKEAKIVHFRRENFTIFEENIISDHKNKKSTEKQILNYWKLWYLNVPVLQEITHLKVYYQKTPLKPEERTKLIINELIFDGSAKQ